MSARRSSSFRAIASVAVVILMAATSLFAQSTTGSIAGSVTTASDKSALPGVTIEAIHVPTGTRYDTVSGSNGRFLIANVRVGGPYKITGSLEGFKATTVNLDSVQLGATSEVAVSMALAAVTEAITVTAHADEVINPNHTGSTSTVQVEQIQTLPTVNRSLQDFARTNPYFVVDAQSPDATVMNVAGRNNRYNSIQIDGAVNNDLFGLAAQGTPGGQANAQPISLDAIQQIQLVVSPYDVRQGGFTGGGVNAVTRSGSNKLEGSVYGTKRSESMVGKNVPVLGPNTSLGLTDPGFAIIEKPITNFDYTQYGGRVGGAILQDKLFFFANGERNRRQQPNGVSADPSNPAVTNYANTTQDSFCGGVAGCSATQLAADLKNKYGFDVGTLADVPQNTPSDLLFLRLDFNATPSNQLTLRNNYVKASTDIFSGNAARTATRFSYPTTVYQQANKTSSTVAQLNSVINSNAFNEARVGYQTIKDQRTVPALFPSIEIGGSNQNATLNAGTERFSGANALDQKITEITDDFTWTHGNHTLVVGTHNELFKFKNLFMSEALGYYFYPNLGAFENQTCGQTINNARVNCEYRITYATGSDPLRPTQFSAAQYGAYIGDQWHASNNVTLQFGLRADKPHFNDTPSDNPIVSAAIGRATSEHASENLILSPRMGFNWNPGGTNQQLRGGVGIFAGRTPYVWISNAYAGTGIEQVSLACLTSANCNVPTFNPDPASQPKLGAAGALSVDLVDPDFQFPRVARATLGYDRDLFWGIRGTVEMLYSKTLQDVYYMNLNNVRTGSSPLDGRPTYSRATTQLVDATFLTNTNKGQEIMESIQLVRPFSRGLTLSGNYAHQHADSSFDATSSRAISNWRFQHSQGDIYTPTIGRSAFEQKNRFNVAATYDFNTGVFGHSLGLFYNAQSGRPYSMLLGSLSSASINGDNNTSNDLLYIPGGADKFILCTSGSTGAPTATNPCGNNGVPLDTNLFQQFIKSTGLDPNKARILNKYESFEPWTRHLDFHYALRLPVKVAQTEVSFDMLNLLHALSKDYGNVYFVSNQNITPVTYNGQDPTTGKPVYREGSTTLTNGTRTFGSLTPGRQFSVADLQSRWQMRLGLRVSF